jgi:hypothetical protein
MKAQAFKTAKDLEIYSLQIQLEALTNAYNELLKMHNGMLDSTINKLTLINNATTKQGE